MKKQTAPCKKYLFICENVREGGKACCGPRAEGFREYLKEYVKSKGLARTIRVSKAGCLDLCGQGPNVLVQPGNVLYSCVTREDLDQILREEVDPLTQ